MAITDRLDFFCQEQVLTGTSYSNCALPTGSLKDYGASYVTSKVYVKACGPFSLGDNIEIQLIGFAEDDFSDPFVINTTGAILQADVNTDTIFGFHITPVGKKYKYMALKFVVAGGSDNSTEFEDITYCPKRPLMSEPEEIPNAFTAFITAGALPSNVKFFPMANADKVAMR